VNDFGISTLDPEACRKALLSFYSEIVELKDAGEWLHLSLPLMNADGFQISISISQISERFVLLSDRGETLSFLDCRGVSTKSKATRRLIQNHIAAFEIETMGEQLTKVVSLPIQGIDMHLFGEALAGLTHLIFRHEANQSANPHVYEAVLHKLESAKMSFKRGAGAFIKGRTSKSIPVDFLISSKRNVAIKAVQRKEDIHEYINCERERLLRQRQRLRLAN
jgi:Domain of unknown function DUF1828